MSEKFEPGRYHLGSASTRDLKASTKLWRYFTFDKFAWLLEKSTLWHTRLDFFEDKFEGAHTNEHIRKRDAGTLHERLQSGLPLTSEQARNKAVIYTNFATCWYESQFESPAMWKLYSTENAGVAVVSSPIRLKESVDLSKFGAGIVSPIAYKDFETEDMLLMPISKGFGRVAMPGLLKQKFFEHENEVRGLVHFIDYSKMPATLSDDTFAEAFRLANPPGIGPHVDLPKLIDEIYISPLAPHYFKEVVEIMVARFGLKDRIRTSALLARPVF